jgi:serine/threonine protein kinase
MTAAEGGLLQPKPPQAPAAGGSPARKTVSERWVDGKLHVGHYEIVGKLGEGSFGTVLKGVHVHVGEPVAIKVLEKSRINTADEIERVGREVQILKSVQHANVCRLWELLYTRDKIYLVMEFAVAGELFGQIVKKGRLKDDEARFYFRQAVEGLDYIHGIDVVHRDIKPENLLIDHTRRLKIVDFGLSARCALGGFLKTACGSPCYAAPEMLTRETRQGYEGHPVDVWSLGVTLFAMLCGYLPFEHPQTAQLYKRIIAGEYKQPAFLSADAKDLLKRMLCTDPKRRFTLEQIRKHPWVWRGVNGSKPSAIPTLHHSSTLTALHEGGQKPELQASVLEMLAKHGYDTAAVVASVQARRHDENAAAYWLALVRDSHATAPDPDESADSEAQTQSHATQPHAEHAQREKENQYPAQSGAQTHRPAVPRPHPPPQQPGRQPPYGHVPQQQQQEQQGRSRAAMRTGAQPSTCTRPTAAARTTRRAHRGSHAGIRSPCRSQVPGCTPAGAGGAPCEAGGGAVLPGAVVVGAAWARCCTRGATCPQPRM